MSHSKGARTNTQNDKYKDVSDSSSSGLVVLEGENEPEIYSRVAVKRPRPSVEPAEIGRLCQGTKEEVYPTDVSSPGAGPFCWAGPPALAARIL